MEELNECAGSGAGGLEGKLIGEGKPRGRALKGRVNIIMDDNAFQNS